MHVLLQYSETSYCFHIQYKTANINFVFVKRCKKAWKFEWSVIILKPFTLKYMCTLQTWTLPPRSKTNEANFSPATMQEKSSAQEYEALAPETLSISFYKPQVTLQTILTLLLWTMVAPQSAWNFGSVDTWDWTLHWKPEWHAWVTMRLNSLYTRSLLRKTSVYITNGMLENGLMYLY